MIETESFAEYVLVEYRWIVVMVALLPISALWKVWSIIRNYVVFKMNSAPKMHDRKVKDVQKQVGFHDCELNLRTVKELIKLVSLELVKLVSTSSLVCRNVGDGS